MLKQKTFLYFISSVINSVLGFVTISIVARYMGPEPMGIIASILAFISLFNIFGDFGFGLAHQKRVSEGKNLSECIGTYASANIILSILIIIVILGVFISNKYFSSTPYIAEKNETIFYVLLGSTFLANILKIISITFAARLEVAKEVVVGSVTKLALSVAKISVALLGYGVIFLAFSNLFSVLIAVILSVFLFRKYPISLPTKKMFRSYAQFAVPVAFMGIVDIYINLDKVFITKFVGVKEVAYYTAAFGLGKFFYFIGSIFVNILLPTFSKLHSHGNSKQIADISIKTERFLSFSVTPIIVFVAVFSTPICLIALGNEFKSSALILSILVIDALIIILSRPYSIQALSSNKVKTALLYQIIIGVLNILLNIVLIPESLFGIKLFGLGGSGAAFALLFANLIGVIMFRVKAKQLSGRGINMKIFLHILIATFIFGTFFLIANSITSLNILLLLICAVVGWILFVLVLVIIKELRKDDIKLIIDFVNVKKLKQYIVGEVKNKDVN